MYVVVVFFLPVSSTLVSLHTCYALLLLPLLSTAAAADVGADVSTLWRLGLFRFGLRQHTLSCCAALNSNASISRRAKRYPKRKAKRTERTNEKKNARVRFAANVDRPSSVWDRQREREKYKGHLLQNVITIAMKKSS